MKTINVFSLKLVKESSKRYDIPSKSVVNPENANEIIQKVFRLFESPVEKVGMLALNTSHDVIGAGIIFVGDVGLSVLSPRQVFAAALLNNAHAVLLFHNHPSGRTKPSEDDIEVTKTFVEAGKILGIKVVDHIITGHDGKFTSMKRSGYMS